MSEVTYQTTSSGLETEIAKALYRYARTVDEQRFHDWLDMFTDDCQYAVTTYENYIDQGLYLFKEDKEGMKLRAAHLLGVWQNARGKTLHTISNIDVTEASEDEARVSSYLVVYRTVADGITQLHCCGQCDDLLVRREGQWLFKQRHVVVDNNLLPYNFTELL
jgi:anthranilate 1,2-dioxygenase small subunit